MNQRRAIDDATKVDGLEMVKEDIKVVEKDRMGGSQVKKDNNGGYRNKLTKQNKKRKLVKQLWCLNGLTKEQSSQGNWQNNHGGRKEMHYNQHNKNLTMKRILIKELNVPFLNGTRPSCLVPSCTMPSRINIIIPEWNQAELPIAESHY